MFTLDILIFLTLIALLFLRQIMVFKNLNKIDYAPLMLGFGALSALVHFMLFSQTKETLLLLQEGAFTLVIALVFYVITNILHQTKQTQLHREELEANELLMVELTHLKEKMSDLEKKLIFSQQEEQKLQENSRENLKQEVKILDTLNTNHVQLAEKFDTLHAWHEEVSLSFENFANVQIPQLDDVVHKHIELLRIAEQEHFHKLTHAIHAALDERYDIDKEFETLKNGFNDIRKISHQIAESIVKESSGNLLGVTKVFENQINALKSHAEAINTTLYEAENKLATIKNHSEMVMKQMALSSKKMSELQEKNSSLQNVSHTLHELLSDVESVRTSYVQSKIELHAMAKELKERQQEDIHAMHETLNTLASRVDAKIEASLNELHQEYKEASTNVTQNVKVLAKKAQLQQGYQQLD